MEREKTITGIKELSSFYCDASLKGHAESDLKNLLQTLYTNSRIKQECERMENILKQAFSNE